MKKNLTKKLGMSLITSVILASGVNAIDFTYDDKFQSYDSTDFKYITHRDIISASVIGQSITVDNNATIAAINFARSNDTPTSFEFRIYEGAGRDGTLLATINSMTKDTGSNTNQLYLYDSTDTLKNIKLKKDNTYTYFIIADGDIGAKRLQVSDTSGASYTGNAFNILSVDSEDFISTIYYNKYAAILETMQTLTKSRFYSVAELFDNATDTDLSAFATALGNYTGEAMAAKIEQATPTVTANAPQVNRQVLGTISNIVSSRQSSTTGLNSGDIAFSDKNVWVKPFGSKTTQDDIDGVSGFDANTYGIAVGVDGEYKDDRRAGISFFYANSSVDTNNVTQSNDIQSFTLVGYGSNTIAKIDNSMLYYQVGYGIQQNDSNRYIELTSQNASADYTTKSIFASIKATKEYKKSDKLTFIPEIGLNLSYFDSPNYTETGAGGLNLQTNSFSANSLVASIGNSLRYKKDENTDFTARASLNYDLNNKANSITSTYTGGGSSFTTEGLKNSSFGYEVGVGMSKELKENLTFDINYDLDGKGSEFKNHSVSAKFNLKF